MLYFKCAFIDAIIHNARKALPALVEKRRRSKVRVARVNRRTVGQQRVRKDWPAVVLQRAKQRVGVDLVARTSEEPAAVIATEIVAVRCDGAAVVSDIGA